MKISVITRWFCERFFAPYFLSHYSWADEIIVLLERSGADDCEGIISQYPNARIIYTETGGILDDRTFCDMASDLAASLDADWVIRADADELIFLFDGRDPRQVLERADGNVAIVDFHWIYRHRDDPDLDPAKPAAFQRRHGGAYTIWPNMGPTFHKPSIVRPSAKIRWRPGEQGYEPNEGANVSSTRFDGVHWQMVDVEEAVRRLLSAEARLSDKNRANNWGVRRFTEAQIRAFCAEHLDDPRVF